MDSKGMERAKACWSVCCLDGRKAACHDGLDRRSVSLRSLLAPAQFVQLYCDKTGWGSSNLQNIWLPLQSCQRTILFWSTVLTTLSDNTVTFVVRQRILLTKQIGLCQTKVHGTKITFGAIGPMLFTANLVHFQNLQKIIWRCTKCRGGRSNQVLFSVSAAQQDGLNLSWQVVCTSWAALTRAHMPRSAVRLGAIQVIVSVVLLMSMASGRKVHTISRFVLYAWAVNDRAGRWVLANFNTCMARWEQQWFTWESRQTAVS